MEEALATILIAVVITAPLFAFAVFKAAAIEATQAAPVHVRRRTPQRPLHRRPEHKLPHAA
jgi:hypothetical protein